MKKKPPVPQVWVLGLLLLFAVLCYWPFVPFFPLLESDEVLEDHDILVFEGTTFTSRTKSHETDVLLFDLVDRRLTRYARSDENILWSSRLKGKFLILGPGSTSFVSGAETETVFSPVDIEGFHYVLAPDGKRVAYEEDCVVHIQNLADSHVMRLPVRETCDSRMNWSPDGEYLVFLSGKIEGGFSDLKDHYFLVYRVRSDGTELLPLTEVMTGVGSSRLLQWSPDGSRIAFPQYGYDPVHDREFDALWILTDTGESRQVPSPQFGGNFGDFVWSPDGSKLAFVFSSPQSSFSFWIWDVVSDEIEPITTLTDREVHSCYNPTLTWVSDTSLVVAVSLEQDRTVRHYVFGSDSERCTGNLFLLDLTTGALTQLTNRQFLEIKDLTWWK